MKKIYLFLLILILGFTSCIGFDPIDMNIQTKNLKVTSNDIVGMWKMDKFSYEYLSDFKKDSVILFFTDNNKFEMNNSQNLFNGKINNETTTGTWEIIEQYETKKIKLNFDDTKNSKELEIYKKKDNFQLWYYLSDPDSGERIRFLK